MKSPSDPKQTRQTILEAAFRRIHRHGFQAAGLSEILAETGLTKGAFYHHFPTKNALGFAVIDELVAEYLTSWWLAPLEGRDDPVEALAGVLQERLGGGLRQMVEEGCPLTNLMCEMAPLDAGFRERLEGLYRQWRKGWARALRHGQQMGNVRTDVDTDLAAMFVIAGLQGAFIQAKTTQNVETFRDCLEGLAEYLAGIRR